MARRNRPPKREIEPDIRYGNIALQKFINRMMRGGKKSIAQGIMYEALDMAEARANRPGIEVFTEAMANVMPAVEVKPRRVGGATYQIPVEVPEYRQLSLCIRWMLAAARNRPGRGMAAKLAAEFVDAASGTGSAVKRREDTLRMAEANRAFAHLRW
jgi:small subunit ribosomal protein S7